MSFYDIPVTMADGRETTMADWQGHALLIVNTASECGFTEQYEGLQKLFEDLAPRGLFVLAQPCNQFGGQEPGSDEEIGQFCQVNFGVQFPLLEKGDVNGEEATPLFKYLKEQTGGEDIAWNFEKFLVSPEGDVVARFPSKVDPEDMEIFNELDPILPV